MEPLDCVRSSWTASSCDVWVGSSSRPSTRRRSPACSASSRSKVKIDTLCRRQLRPARAADADYRRRGCARSPRRSAGKRPVKLVWTREDDITRRLLPPAVRAPRCAALDAPARSSPGQHRIVGQSIMKGTPFEACRQERHRLRLRSKARRRLPYDDRRTSQVDLHTADVGVPMLWWRSVGHTHTAYAVEALRRRARARRPARIRSTCRLAC